MNAFPGSLSTVTAGVIDAYVEATLEGSEEAIVRSIEQYRSGRVEEHRGAFAPAAPDFARNVRAWDKALAVLAEREAPKRDRLVSYPIGELPPPPLEPLGPLEVDMGNGRIDMRGMTHAEKEAILTGKPAPDKFALAKESAKRVVHVKPRKIDGPNDAT